MRYYALRAGTLADLMKRWESKIEERLKMSPIALAGAVEHGEANRFIHIWAYKSLDERTAIRDDGEQDHAALVVLAGAVSRARSARRAGSRGSRAARG